jgi:hypothetical protein
MRTYGLTLMRTYGLTFFDFNDAQLSLATCTYFVGAGLKEPLQKGATALFPNDHTLLLVAAQIGLRLSELIDLDRNDIHLAPALMCAVSAKDGRSGPLR